VVELAVGEPGEVVQIASQRDSPEAGQLLGDRFLDGDDRSVGDRHVVAVMDRQQDHREHIGRQRQRPLRDLDPCADVGTTEGSVDLQLRAPPIATELGDAEHEPIDVDVGERLHRGEGDVVVGA
jgi:hypothetical protein